MRHSQGCLISMIIKINNIINQIVWGAPLLTLIFFTGIFYTVRLGFFQFKYVKEIFRDTLGCLFNKRKVSEANISGNISSFQAAMTSVCAIVGSGNIVGVATAIVIGGPGTIFWMWVAAFFGMATKFAEIVLGIIYRKNLPDGSITGGAMYYLAEGLHCKLCGRIFSVLVIPFAYVVSGIVDSNTITGIVYEKCGISTVVTGLILAAFVGSVIFGGITKIGRVCSIVAPFMGAFYLSAGLLILLVHIQEVPMAFKLIFQNAFNLQSIFTGSAGTVFLCIKNGVARGVYSNEAGLGTAAMLHSGAQVRHPVQQGVWGPVEVFFDTMIVCTVSGLTIILSGMWKNASNEGAALTMNAFEQLLPGNWGGWIVFIAVILFGFTSLISYYIYAERAIVFLSLKIKPRWTRFFWIISILIGSQSTLGFVWNLADTCNGLMIIPNLIGLLFLSNKVVNLKKEYFGED